MQEEPKSVSGGKFCPFLKDNCRPDCVFWSGPDFQINESTDTHYGNLCAFQLLPYAIGDLLSQLKWMQHDIGVIGTRTYPDLIGEMGDEGD